METIRIRIYRLLRLSEQYTRTDMIYATRSTFWLMIAQVSGALVSLVLSVIFARFLSKETFGIYRYIISMAGIASAFSLTGINSAVTRAVAQGFEGIFRKSILIQIQWAIPQFIFGLALSGYYFYQLNTIYGICFLIIAFANPIASTANTYAAFLNGKKDFRKATEYSVLSNILYLLAMATISIWYPNTIALITGFYVTNAVVNSYFCFTTIKNQTDKNAPYRPEDIAYSKNLSVMNIIATMAQHLDNIAVYYFLGPAQLATYTFSTIIPERIRSMSGIISTAAFPKLAEKDHTGGEVHLKQKVLRLLMLAAIIIVAYFIAAPFIYKIFFPQYLDTVLYSQVFSLSLFAIASNIPIPALFTQKKEKELYIISVGLPIIKIIFSMCGILFFGIWGAIIAKILHNLFHVSLSTYLASRT